MEERFVPGCLYRAVTSSEVVPYESIPVEGLKLLLQPNQVRILRRLQKALRAKLGRKPDMTVTLNALVATSDPEAQLQAIEAWIREQRSSGKAESAESQSSSQERKETTADFLRSHCGAVDDER
jgi:hypothetical protein